MGPRFAFAALIIAFGIAITFATLKPALAHRAARSDRQPRAEYGVLAATGLAPVRPGGSFARRRPQEEGDVGIPNMKLAGSIGAASGGFLSLRRSNEPSIISTEASSETRSPHSSTI
jgi:hypothetical protein